MKREFREAVKLAVNAILSHDVMHGPSDRTWIDSANREFVRRVWEISFLTSPARKQQAAKALLELADEVRQREQMKDRERKAKEAATT